MNHDSDTKIFSDIYFVNTRKWVFYYLCEQNKYILLWTSDNTIF